MANGGGFCDVCGSERVYREGGVSRSGPRAGQAYNPSWRCPTQNCPGKAIWLKAQGGPPQLAPQAAPVAPRPNGQGPSVTDRSIAAQACCKAACEAAAGAIGPLALSPGQAHEWIVTLARQLYNGLVMPATEGQPMRGSPIENDEDVPNFR